MEIFNTWLVNKYIAHRGLHNKEYAENSISAFKNAIDNNYPIELDVQQIADGTVVVFHDETLQRLTGKHGYVKNIKSSNDLKGYKLNKTKDCIPTFEQVLSVVKGQVPILIEIKNNGKVGKLEQTLIDMLNNYKGEYAIMSFNPFVLAYFKNNAPHILRGQLSCSFKNEKLAWFKKVLLRRLALHRIASFNFIAYEATALPYNRLKKFKNVPLLAWTVRSQEQYLEVAKHCDNIIFENFEPKI